MNTLNVVLFFYLTNTVLTKGFTNLLGFYAGFRKLCLCRCGISSSQVNNIHNGRSLNSDIYTPYSMPWLARIHAGTTTLRGTLLSDRHVITAANPLYRKSSSEVTVTLGGNDLCKEGGHTLNTSVEAVLLHPGYTPTVKNNDIALLKLRNPVQFSDYISPVCMPLFDTVGSDQLGWTASWLKNGSEFCVTRISTLPILSSRSCNGNNLSIGISDKNCLGPLGTKNIICENDVGGPVMTRWLPGSPFRLIGVITSAMCDKEVTPLFTRIVDNMLWIHGHIRKDCQCL